MTLLIHLSNHYCEVTTRVKNTWLKLVIKSRYIVAQGSQIKTNFLQSVPGENSSTSTAAPGQTFIFVVGNNRERGEIEAVKKRFVIVKNSTQSFFPSTLFSVLKTNLIKIFEMILNNKPVSNDIYNEVVELNPSLLYWYWHCYWHD